MTPADGSPSLACQIEKVIVGHPLNIISVPVLQLISSLPRSEVFLNRASEHYLAFRFNKGFGFASIIERRTLADVPSYHLWQKQHLPFFD